MCTRHEQSTRAGAGGGPSSRRADGAHRLRPQQARARGGGGGRGSRDAAGAGARRPPKLPALPVGRSGSGVVGDQRAPTRPWAIVWASKKQTPVQSANRARSHRSNEAAPRKRGRVCRSSCGVVESQCAVGTGVVFKVVLQIKWYTVTLPRPAPRALEESHWRSCGTPDENPSSCTCASS